MSIDRLAYFGVRILLGSVFVMSGVSKQISPQAASDFIASIVPAAASITVALVRLFSVLEIVLAYLILRGKQEKHTSAITMMIFPFFSTIGVLLGSPDQACGCFGDFSPSYFDEYFLLRNTILLFFSMYFGWYTQRTRSLLREFP